MRSSIASSKKQHACMHAAVTVSRSAAGPGVDDRLHALRRNSNIFESLAAVVVRRRQELPSLHVFNGRALTRSHSICVIGSLSHRYPHIMWGARHATRTLCPATTRHKRRPPACQALPSDTNDERASLASLQPFHSAGIIPCSRQRRRQHRPRNLCPSPSSP
jgi:hypothetical protein